MSTPEEIGIALGVIFAVNLLPAFGPPTWAVLVFFSFEFDLPTPALVLGGALAAASGRLVLASVTRRLRPRLSHARVESIDRSEAALTKNRLRTAGGLGLFALSPVPSGQLFVGAGLMKVPLVPLTAAFFAGRLVSYSIYVGAASVASDSLCSIAVDSLTSPLGIGIQLAMLVVLALLAGGLNPGADHRPGRDPRGLLRYLPHRFRVSWAEAATGTSGDDHSDAACTSQTTDRDPGLGGGPDPLHHKPARFRRRPHPDPGGTARRSDRRGGARR